MEAMLGLVLSAAALGVLLTWPRWGLSPRMRRDQLGPAQPLPEAQHGSLVTLSGHLEVAEPLAGPTEADVDRTASAEGKAARATTTEQGWGGASHAAWSLAHGEAATAVCSQGAAGLALCTGAARLPLEGQVEVVLGSRESRLASPRPRRRGRTGATFVRALAPGDLVRVEARLAPASDSYRGESRSRLLAGTSGRIRLAAEKLPPSRAWVRSWRIVVAAALLVAPVFGLVARERMRSSWWASTDCVDRHRSSGRGDLARCAPDLSLAKLVPWLRSDARQREQWWQETRADLALDDATALQPDEDEREQAARAVYGLREPTRRDWVDWGGALTHLADRGAHAFVLQRWRSARSSRDRLAALAAAVSRADVEALRGIARIDQVGEGYWSEQLLAAAGAWQCALGEPESGRAALARAGPIDELYWHRRRLRARAAEVCDPGRQVPRGWPADLVLGGEPDLQGLLDASRGFEPAVCGWFTSVSPYGSEAPESAAALEEAAQALERRSAEASHLPGARSSAARRQNAATLRRAAWALWIRASMERLHRGQRGRALAGLGAAEALETPDVAHCGGTVHLLAGDAAVALGRAELALGALPARPRAPDDELWTDRDRHAAAAALLRDRALTELGRFPEVARARDLPESFRAQLAVRGVLLPISVAAHDPLSVGTFARIALQPEKARRHTRWDLQWRGPIASRDRPDLLGRADVVYVLSRMVEPPHDPEVWLDRVEGPCLSRECMRVRETAARWRGDRTAEREWAARRSRLEVLAGDERRAALLTLAEAVLEDAMRE